MKQVKFLMVALTILMGTMVTSCMNGETDTIQTSTEFVKVVESYPLTFETAYGLKLVATNTPKDFDPYSTKKALIQYRFDTATQPVDQNTKKLNIEVLGIETIDAHSMTFSTEEESKTLASNAPIMSLGVTSQQVPLMYFDKNTLITAILYKAKEDRKKHTFTLVYCEDQTKSESTVLKFYLRHKSEEEKPNLNDLTYKAFDISEALYHFKSVTQKNPSEILVCAEVSANGSSMEDVKELTEYKVDYKFED